jgi:hypothetical protein
VVFWPDEMEKAWIEMFADDKFRNEIQDRWSRFLGERQVGDDPRQLPFPACFMLLIVFCVDAYLCFCL